MYVWTCKEVLFFTPQGELIKHKMLEFRHYCEASLHFITAKQQAPILFSKIQCLICTCGTPLVFQVAKPREQVDTSASVSPSPTTEWPKVEHPFYPCCPLVTPIQKQKIIF